MHFDTYNTTFEDLHIYFSALFRTTYQQRAHNAARLHLTQTHDSASQSVLSKYGPTTLGRAYEV